MGILGHPNVRASMCNDNLIIANNAGQRFKVEPLWLPSVPPTIALHAIAIEPDYYSLSVNRSIGSLFTKPCETQHILLRAIGSHIQGCIQSRLVFEFVGNDAPEMRKQPTPDGNEDAVKFLDHLEASGDAAIVSKCGTKRFVFFPVQLPSTEWALHASRIDQKTLDFDVFVSFNN